ncbi:hydroxyacylglutathione hydrolase [Schizosaccharomyces japonicus yFS275]|uniref:hydroxyacylglutathione hydrolase n=1 Tax=Schizosaccharomyces japonicus (strain yFS275 / FY16936) TaxID=402676 RepID=B6JYD6_SCHJY|nr:hydroxyacylglutathione hydrolase [Schizosaccharomyces japonicus yFS275]EEB06554.1 hydroxyacylglutathione hydrolase [Schizosaccharomyces japonicus yFS275]
MSSFHIKPIWMWKGSGDNYAYLLTCDKTKAAAIVDPAEPSSVIPILKNAIANKEIDLKAIITTHHHSDHAGGNRELLKQFPNLTVYGGQNVSQVSHVPKDHEVIQIGDVKVTALHTPCHTRDSICYYVDSPEKRAVFTGDTLFTAGCGRFFEGEADEMDHALNTVLGSLPDDTVTYPGHEYTKSNAAFASKVFSTPALTKLVEFCKSHESTTGQFTIGDEKKFNPFFQLSNADVRAATKTNNRVDTMAKLRAMKNAS